MYKIICDIDGKILTFDKNCEKIFNLLFEDVFLKKRIYNLIHSDFIVNFIGVFDAFLKSNNISYKDSTFFYGNNKYFSGTFFLKKRGKFLEVNIIQKIIKRNEKKNKFLSFEKFNLIFRSKFIFGSIVPFIFSVFWSFSNYNKVSFDILCILFLGITFLHIAANTFNDYFDWKSGRDKLNTDYVLFSTGGSRAVDFKFVSEKTLLIFSLFSFLIVLICGIYIYLIRGIEIILIGLIGVFSVYFYSAPPVHLASRYGLGELMHILCLGPLLVYGCVFSLTGESGIKEMIIGFPFGFLITACLLINEYPDSKFDKISGKFNLAVILGKYVSYAFSFFVIIPFLFIIFGIFFMSFPIYFLLVFFLIKYVFDTIKCVFSIANDRYFMFKSCVRSFNIYIFFSFVLIIALFFDYFF